MGNICSYFSFCIDDFDKEVIEKSENIRINIHDKQNIHSNDSQYFWGKKYLFYEEDMKF
jgi:hypothetical protein